MSFIKSAILPSSPVEQAYYCCFSNEDILLKSVGDGWAFPFWNVAKARASGFEGACFIGTLDGKPCYALTVTEKNTSDGYHWIRLRDFYAQSEPEAANMAGYARQISDWNRNFRFCGRCASPTEVLPNEHARRCQACGLINYPRISPAVITAVINGDQILLARGRHYSDKEMFSLLAGFLEPGESLEEAVSREIFEEVGIEVVNVRYLKSQPWPFPDSLMIGFAADYHRGSIKIDENEIIEAKWFKADALPKIPARRSISSEIIRMFVDGGLK